MEDEFYFLTKSSAKVFLDNFKEVQKKIVEYAEKVVKTDVAKVLLVDAEEAEQSYGIHISFICECIVC